MRGVYGIPTYGERSFGVSQSQPGLPPSLEACRRRTAVCQGQQPGQVSRSGYYDMGREPADSWKWQAAWSKERNPYQTRCYRVIAQFGLANLNHSKKRATDLHDPESQAGTADLTEW